MKERIAILGAGPIGLEAALYARTLGYEAQVYEQGHLAEHVRRWGHVTLFSQFALNHSPLGARALEERTALPKPEELLTGGQYRQRYLLELARLPLLEGRIQEGTKVLAIGRSGILKGEHIASQKRRGHPFRLLLAGPSGKERIEMADIIFDCTGVYSAPNWAGEGGIPAPGEQQLRMQGRWTAEIPDVLGADRAAYAGRHTLLVGGGTSAATTAVALASLAEQAPGTRWTWVLREPVNPYRPMDNDPLPGRAALYTAARRSIEQGHPALTVMLGAEVHAFLAYSPIEAELNTAEGRKKVAVDQVVTNVGYQPDNSIYSELQVHECYASRGPMSLAAALLQANSGEDCLAQTGVGADALKNPEPAFFILGSKSYGKNSQFLIRLGLEQVRDAFRLITGQPELDLYSTQAP